MVGQPFCCNHILIWLNGTSNNICNSSLKKFAYFLIFKFPSKKWTNNTTPDIYTDVAVIFIKANVDCQRPHIVFTQYALFI